MKSKTFCVMPWNSIATNASGIYRVCCNSTPGKNVINDDNGQPTKIFKNSPSQIWNSYTYKKIRAEMLSNVRPEMCERCFKEEDSGIESARMNWNKRWYNESKNYDVIEKNMDIQYIDLRLGNLCNLKCRMCNPYSSSQWVDEWNQVVDTAELVPNFKISDDESVRLSSLDWPTRSKTWENIIEIADTIEEIYLTGGEPTLAIEQYKLFEILKQKKLTKKIKLKYNTNLTNIPKKMIDYWRYFKKIQINASIDAFADLNRYIRFPTSWDMVDKNIEKFVNMKNVEVQLHCTVQMYNILKLHELFEWMKKFQSIKLYLNILNHPRSMNIRVLPKELKIIAEENLQDYLDLPKVEQVIKYMNDKDESEFLNEFFNYTIKLDQLRKQNLFNLVPELEKYYVRSE
jgi:molybdenum cofactor biosynthesis enzyme MoaA